MKRKPAIQLAQLISLGLACIVGWPSTVTGREPAAERHQPNLIQIMADDLGAKVLAVCTTAARDVTEQVTEM
jgi:hypothetical protein